MALFLSQKPYKRYGLIGPDYAYGHDQLNSFKKEMAKLKPDAEVLDPVWVKIGESNLSPFIPTLMAKNPDAIYCSLLGRAIEFVYKARHSLRPLQKSGSEFALRPGYAQGHRDATCRKG